MTAGKKAHRRWEGRIAQQQARIAQLTLLSERVGEIKEAAGIYAEPKVQVLAERKLRFAERELGEQWDKIQRRERQALIPKIEQSRSLEEGLVQTLVCLAHQKNK